MMASMKNIFSYFIDLVLLLYLLDQFELGLNNLACPIEKLNLSVGLKDKYNI